MTSFTSVSLTLRSWRSVTFLLNAPDLPQSSTLSVTFSDLYSHSHTFHYDSFKKTKRKVPVFPPVEKWLSCSLTCDHSSGKWVISLSVYEEQEKKTNEGNWKWKPSGYCPSMFLVFDFPHNYWVFVQDSLIYLITGSGLGCWAWRKTVWRIPDEWVHVGYVWAGIP